MMFCIGFESENSVRVFSFSLTFVLYAKTSV